MPCIIVWLFHIRAFILFVVLYYCRMLLCSLFSLLFLLYFFDPCSSFPICGPFKPPLSFFLAFLLLFPERNKKKNPKQFSTTRLLFWLDWPEIETLSMRCRLRGVQYRSILAKKEVKFMKIQKRTASSCVEHYLINIYKLWKVSIVE